MNGRIVSFFFSLALSIFKDSAQIKISIIFFSATASLIPVSSENSAAIVFKDLGSFLLLCSPSFLTAMVLSSHIAMGFSSIAFFDKSFISAFKADTNASFDGITSFVEYVNDSTITFSGKKSVSKNLVATFATSFFCSSIVPVAIVADVPMQRIFLFLAADLILLFSKDTSAPCLPL